ncbi:MAG: FHA domain-containing protein [Bradymonadia bacterium]|jgi:hypothetical protein
MTRSLRIAASMLAATLLLLPPLAHAQEVRNTQGSTFLRLDAVDVSNAELGQFVFFASFLDRGRKPVTALDPKAWTASFDGNPIEADLTVKKLFESDQGISLVVVLQNDHVAKESFLDSARKGVKRTLSTLRQLDKSAVVLFRDTTDKSGTLSPAHNETSSWMDTIQDGGLTPILYESIEQALGLFPAEFSAIGPNRAVLVISDGADQRDNQAGEQKDQLQKIVSLATKRRVHVHAIGAPSDLGIEGESTEKLRKVVEQTGGTWRKATTPAELENYLSHFEQEVAGQHVVKLTTNDFDGDKDVAFKLEVNQDGSPYPSNAVIALVPKAKSNVLKYVLVGGGVLLGLVLLFFVVRLVLQVIRNREPAEAVATGPELRPCGQCTNQIPQEWKVCQYCEALPHKGRLRVKSSGELNGRVWFIKESLTNIGSAEGNAIIVPDKSVSKRHAGIKVQDNRFELADYGSTNGVMVNGQRMTKQFLKSGDLVTIGGVEMEFTLK